jgi:hypothetical protein
MILQVTLPPEGTGSPPHRHTGPAFGYVVEGEMIFDSEGAVQFRHREFQDWLIRRCAPRSGDVSRIRL